MGSSTTIPEQLDAPEPAAGEVTPSQRGDVLVFGGGIRGVFRASTSFLAVLTLVLIGLQFIFALYRPDMNDPDIWWHMRNAQYLLQNHQFPRTDMYSFTVAGHPWINHEWLSEIPYYLAYESFGLVGLKTLCFLIFDTIFLLLLYLCFQESRNFKGSVTVCYFATFFATVSFGPRTMLSGYVFLILLLIVLQKYRKQGHAPLWSIPIIFFLWINCHGSWSQGLIVLFLIAVSGLVEGVWGRVESAKWTSKQIKELAITGVATVAALFLNPFGWRLVWYPFDMAFKQKAAIIQIAEWASVDFHEMRGKMTIILIVGLMAAALFRSRRWNLGGLLVLFFALYSGLTYIRFLVLLGIVAAPVLAQALDFFPLYRPQDETPKVNMAVIVLIIGLMIYFWPREATVRASVEQTYPAGVLPYLKAHPPQGNVANFFIWGGYLGWHDRNFKTFIDSRVDIFQYEGVFDDYLGLMGADLAQHKPDAILNKYNVKYVLFPPADSTNPLHTGGGLVYTLQQEPQWKTVYKDKVCVLLERQ